MKRLRPASQTLSSASGSGASGASRVAPVLGAALVWLLLALCVGYWGLRWWGQTPAQVLPAAAPADTQIDSRRVALALGAPPAGAPSPTAAPAPAAVPAAANLRLVGVLSSPKGQGAALIGVGGQAPKPFRVGATVDTGLVLKALGARHAELGPDLQGPTTVRLELPPGSATVSSTVPVAAPVGMPPPQNTVAPLPAATPNAGLPVMRPMPVPQSAD